VRTTTRATALATTATAAAIATTTVTPRPRRAGGAATGANGGAVDSCRQPAWGWVVWGQLVAGPGRVVWGQLVADPGWVVWGQLVAGPGDDVTLAESGGNDGDAGWACCGR
jgi:hypothetical protein